MIPVDILVMVLTIVFFPICMILVMRHKTVGKMVCFFLEKDKSIRAKLLTVEGDWVRLGKETYQVVPERVRLIKYPMGWPSILQQTVPASQYQRTKATPLDWVDLSQKGASAIEVGAVMEPTWFAHLVRGHQDQDKKTKLEKMFPLLALALGGLTLVMIYILLTKLNAISAILG